MGVGEVQAVPVDNRLPGVLDTVGHRSQSLELTGSRQRDDAQATFVLRDVNGVPLYRDPFEGSFAVVEHPESARLERPSQVDHGDE